MASRAGAEVVPATFLSDPLAVRLSELAFVDFVRFYRAEWILGTQFFAVSGLSSDAGYGSRSWPGDLPIGASDVGFDQFPIHLFGLSFTFKLGAHCTVGSGSLLFEKRTSH